MHDAYSFQFGMSLGTPFHSQGRPNRSEIEEMSPFSNTIISGWRQISDQSHNRAKRTDRCEPKNLRAKLRIESPGSGVSKLEGRGVSVVILRQLKCKL